MNSTLKKVFEVYVFAFAVFFTSRPINDGDFWFHLKTGEYLFKTGTIPRTDLFSFTNYGIPWIAHGWLSGAIFYAVYSRLGFNALIIIFAILTAVAFWITYKRSNAHPFVRGFATLIGISTVLPNIGVRPRVFTLLLASVYLALLARYAREGKGRLIWSLVPLMVLWANLHGAFLIGLALIVFTIVGIPLDAWLARESVRPMLPRLTVLGLILLGCILASLINPWGVRIYSETIEILRSPVYQQVVIDWQSPNFHQPELFPLTLLVLSTIAALALSPKRVKPSELLLFLAMLYSTLKMQRNSMLLALVAVPLFADYFQNWLQSMPFGKMFDKPESHVGGRGAVLASLLLLLPLIPFGVKLKSKIYSPPTQEQLTVPVKAVEYLKAKQITGNTLTEPNIWGGYLIWELPSNPVYIDGRGLYPEPFVQEYVGIILGVTDWHVPFNRYGVRVVIIEPKSPLGLQLKDSPDWQQVYEDEMSLVFTKR